VHRVLATLDSAAAIDDDAVARLACHRWPGNFRELRSVLTRALLHGPARIGVAEVERWLPAAAPAPASVLQQGASELVRREFERCGSVSETARALKISRTTVYRHLRGVPPRAGA
jgi:transcriptional regulator of acetoin/glycerol metabolism